MGKVVLVTGTVLIPDEAPAMIRSAGLAVRRVARDDLSDEELHEALAGVAGYVIGGLEKPSATHFEQARSLEAVAFTGTDYRTHVPGWRRAMELGIAMMSCPGSNAVSVAESTVLLMLVMARPSAFAVHPHHSGRLVPPDIELAGRTLGLVGYGEIGSRVAVAAREGLGMTVIYHTRRPLPGIPDAHVDLAELLDRADIVSLHRPGLATGERAVLGRDEFARIRRGSILINTAHPSLVDPQALAWAIDTRQVRAAVEGVVSSPDWLSPAVFGGAWFLGLPTVSHNTREANRRVALRAAAAVCDILTCRAPVCDVAAQADRPRRQCGREMRRPEERTAESKL